MVRSTPTSTFDLRRFTIIPLVSFPHYFLSAKGHLAEQLKTREWIVARITLITERVVDHRVSLLNTKLIMRLILWTKDPDSNPYALGDGVKYYMLEVEDWTQPNNHPSKRRVSSRKLSSASESTPKWESLLPVPAEPEAEESFNEARPRVFAARSRSNSSPITGPSSLSRLLAQAGSEPPLEPIAASRGETPSPIAMSPSQIAMSPSQIAISPFPTTVSPPQIEASPSATSSAQPPGQTPTNPSPMRPGSRASRVSITSRPSIGRLIAPGTTKSTPTTAITGQPISASRSAGNSPTMTTIELSNAPSPEGSPSDGMSMHHRRRTTSYTVSKTSPLAHATTTTSTSTATTASAQGLNGVGSATAGSRLASLANSWGVSFGRRKKLEDIPSLDSITQGSSSSDDAEESSATDLLKKF